MKTIIDISKHQKGIDIKKLSNIDGVIYRRSIGTSKLDDCLADFMAQKTPIAVYVASYAKNAAEARAEADYAMALCKQYNVQPIIFFDWEYFSADYIKKQFGVETTQTLVRRLTEAFCDRCIDGGFLTGAYFNHDYLNRFYGKIFFDNLHPEYRTWYARPGYDYPDYDCDIWQYASNSGAEFGYAGNIDKNKILKEERFFEAEKTEKMKPLSENPVKLKIGFASSGDIAKITAKIAGLGIEYTVENGYIYTADVSAGDQCYILTDCHALNVYCVILEDEIPAEPPKEEETKPEAPETPKEPEKETEKDDKNENNEQPEEKKSLFRLIIDFILSFFEK